MLKEAKCVIWDLDNTIWEGILTEDNVVALRPNSETKNFWLLSDFYRSRTLRPYCKFYFYYKKKPTQRFQRTL
jgi:hypothetical protein